MEVLYRIRFFDRRGGVIKVKYYQSEYTFNRGIERAEKRANMFGAPDYKTHEAQKTQVEWK